MSKKNLKLLGVLVVLVLIAFFISGPLENRQKKANNIFSQIIFEKITKLEIINEDSKVVLEKNNDSAKWKIAEIKDFELDPNLEEDLNDLLQNLSKTKFDLISEKSDKKDSLLGGSGIQVKIFEGENSLGDFLVGKIGPTYPSTYISPASSNKVYLADQDFLSVFSADSWYDKNIFSLKTDLLNKIRVQHGGEQYILELNNEKKWTGTSPTNFEINQEKLDEIILAVSNLNAIEIPEQKFEGTGLEKHNLILQFLGEDIDHTLMIGDEDPQSGNYYLKRADSDNLYLISEEQKNIFDLKMNDLKR